MGICQKNKCQDDCPATLLKNIDLCIISLRLSRNWVKGEKTHIGSARAPQGQSDRSPGYEKVCPDCQSAAPEKRVRGLDQQILIISIILV